MARYKLRAQKIGIEIPRSSSEPWVFIIVQRVELNDDDTEKHAIDRWGMVNEKLTDRYHDIWPVIDPLDPGIGLISVAGVAAAIKVAAVLWMKEKYGGEINENGDLILTT